MEDGNPVGKPSWIEICRCTTSHVSRSHVQKMDGSSYRPQFLDLRGSGLEKPPLLVVERINGVWEL